MGLFALLAIFCNWMLQLIDLDLPVFNGGGPWACGISSCSTDFLNLHHALPSCDWAFVSLKCRPNLQRGITTSRNMLPQLPCIRKNTELLCYRWTHNGPQTHRARRQLHSGHLSLSSFLSGDFSYELVSGNLPYPRKTFALIWFHLTEFHGHPLTVDEFKPEWASLKAGSLVNLSVVAF